MELLHLKKNCDYIAGTAIKQLFLCCVFALFAALVMPEPDLLAQGAHLTSAELRK